MDCRNADREAIYKLIYEENWQVFGFKVFKSYFTLCRAVIQLHVCMCTKKCLVPEEARRM